MSHLEELEAGVEERLSARPAADVFRDSRRRI